MVPAPTAAYTISVAGEQTCEALALSPGGATLTVAAFDALDGGWLHAGTQTFDIEAPAEFFVLDIALSWVRC